MKGFFEIEEKQDSCSKCILYTNCNTRKMKPIGEGKKKILIIGESSGKFFKEILNKYQIDLDKDCWLLNSVICPPTKKGTTTSKEINFCMGNLHKTIKQLNPEKIITFGKPSLHILIGERISVSGIEKWIGWKIPDQDLKCWLFPNYHTQDLHCNQNDIVVKNIFIKTLKQAIEHKEKFISISNKVTKLKTPFEAGVFLDSLSCFPSPIIIDYETTGLKPQKKGHKILCVSICYTKDESVSFPIFENREFLIKLKKVLKNKKIKKIAHNLKFENTWSKKIFHCNIEGWEWDTMIAAHSLDNRTGISGLKFQAYVNFGIADYDNKIKKYIEAKEDGFNQLDKIPIDDLLQYCGEDTIYTYNLWKKQTKQIDNDREKGNSFFMEGQKTFSDIEQYGINIDTDYYLKQDIFLQKKLNLLHKKIMLSQEVKKWTGENFNFNSSTQLGKLLFDILKIKSIKKTAKGNNSTDSSVLEKIDLPFVKKIVEHKKFYKIKNTYLSQFIKEMEGDKVYPSYNLNLVKSFRSSSSNPNFQNIPKRDEKAKKITRTGIIPSFGNQLLEVDYSGIEVRISACYHHDPVMIEYINNPESDMHRDTAQQIFKKKNISKQERYLAKNQFVFPQFYGSYFVECAKNLWKNSEKELPFTNYNKFEKHIENIEYDFWNNRFKVYNQWKKDAWKKYQKYGKIKLHTGFVCTGNLKKNDVTNYPIQGSAFHCLLWSLIQLNNYLKEYKTKIIGQIHDSIIFDFVPEEKEKLFPLIKKVMTEDIREHWKWIIVPLDIEAEISEINGNWYKMKEIENGI